MLLKLVPDTIKISPELKVGTVFVDLTSIVKQDKTKLIQSLLSYANQLCKSHNVVSSSHNLAGADEHVELYLENGKLAAKAEKKDLPDIDAHSILIMINSVDAQDHLVIKNCALEIVQYIESKFSVPVQVNVLDAQNSESHITVLNHSKEHLIRLEKVSKLRAMGIEPWPDNRIVKNSCQEVLNEFADDNLKEYVVAGRVTNIRLHGKAAFFIIHDNAQALQIYIKTDVVGIEKFNFFEHFIDLGDIVWVTGTVFKTKTGQITLNAKDVVMLSKCLYPLPEKFHGLVDIEIKYRQRYLDLIVSDDTKKRFIKRSQIIANMRNYLDNNGYVEVETPMLHPIAGGAAAKPFVTHHNALSSDFYLRIAPELYLKRLVVGGLDRVYEINRNFRNEGISTRHNPEFTMLEFYTAYQDYNFSMSFVEALLQKMALTTCQTLHVQYGEHVIDFSKFEKLSVKNSVIKYCSLNLVDLDSANIDKTLLKLKVHAPKNSSVNQKIYAIFESEVESKLINPTFIIDYPIEISPLTKRDSKNPDIAPRYELFIAGMEVANSYNELNDPIDQAARFEDQVKEREGGNVEAHLFDADFIKALEYGLPPTVGVGIGIDRLVMILTNTTSIKEVILFPTLKRKH